VAAAQSATIPIPPGPTPSPPVVEPTPPPASPTAVETGPVPGGVPVPPGALPVPPAIGLGSLSALQVLPGAMPVPPRGMPIPPRGALPSLSGAAANQSDGVAVEHLLGDAHAHSSSATESSTDDTSLSLSLPLSNEGLRNLGLAAIALGLAALGLSWVPFLGLALAIVGLAASGTATVVGSSRRGAPLGFTLAGAVIGVIAAGLGAYWTYSSLTESAKARVADVGGKQPPAGGPTAMSSQPVAKRLSAADAAVRFSEGALVGAAGGDARDDRDPVKFAAGAFRQVQSSLTKEIAAASNQARPRNGRPRLVFGGNENGNGLVVSAEKPHDFGEEGAADKRSDGATPETQIQWAAAEKGESQGSGPLQVTVSKVVIGKVVSYPIGDLQTLINVTSDQYMIIWLKIKNTDTAGSAEFSGWMSPRAEDEKIGAQLVDDHGREHKPVRPFNKDEAIQKTTPPGKVFAGQTANDAVVFRVLTDDVDSMDLTLSGKAIGRDEDLHFRIPRSMFVHDNSNPLLGGAGN
jgi:hypothetical protein